MKTNYQKVKQELKELKRELKQTFTDDKPYIRMALNDRANYLIIDYDLTEHQTELLSNFVCTLHP